MLRILRILRNLLLKMKKYICGLVLAGSLFSSGCDGADALQKRNEEYQKGKEGVVIQESGSIIDRQKYLEQSPQGFLSNETVRLGSSTYAFKFKTSEGETYSISIADPSGTWMEGLALAIEPGCKVRVRPNNRYTHSVQPLKKIDVVWAEDVTLLENQGN